MNHGADVRNQPLMVNTLSRARPAAGSATHRNTSRNGSGSASSKPGAGTLPSSGLPSTSDKAINDGQNVRTLF